MDKFNTNAAAEAGDLTSALSLWAALVVGGGKALIAVLADVLELHGTTVYFVKNGPQALKQLAVVRPTVIFIDLSLPTLDGWMLLSRVKSDPHLASTPLVAVIEPMPADYQQHLIDSGFAGYVTLPVELAFMLSSLNDQIPALFATA